MQLVSVHPIDLNLALLVFAKKRNRTIELLECPASGKPDLLNRALDRGERKVHVSGISPRLKRRRAKKQDLAMIRKHSDKTIWLRFCRREIKCIPGHSIS